MDAPTFENTFGSLLIGTFFATCLFGVVTLQAHHYFTRYTDDRTQMKLTVLSLWILDLAHTIGTTHDVYTHTIRPTTTMDGPSILPGVNVATLMGGLITMIVQVSLSIRAYRALHRPWNLVGMLCGGLAVARCLTVIILVARLFSAKDYRQSIVDLGGLITGLLSSGAAIDVFIAVAMLYFLLMQRDTAFRSAQRLVDRLMLITIRSGLLTSITAVAVLVVFQVEPYTLAWLAVYTCLAKLYTITFLSGLNGREELRNAVSSGRLSDIRITKPRLESVESGHFTKLSSRSRRKPSDFCQPAISIEMVTTTDITLDGEKLDDIRGPGPAYPNGSGQRP